MKAFSFAGITKKGKISVIVVKWIDPTWHSDKNVFDTKFSCIEQISAGLFITENKKFIRIALNIDEEGFGEFIDIPKSLIIKRWEYRLPKEFILS